MGPILTGRVLTKTARNPRTFPRSQVGSGGLPGPFRADLGPIGGMVGECGEGVVVVGVVGVLGVGGAPAAPPGSEHGLLMGRRA